MKLYTFPLALSSVCIVHAASYSVNVGEDGLVFSPNSTTAAMGDTVTFHFYPRAHGVARSSYSSPCAAIDNGFNSGFVKVASGESNTTFTITVNDTQPIWYYCPQGDHCQAGMVGVINPPSSDETIGGFGVAASSANTSTVPEQVYGGVLGAEDATGGMVAASSAVVSSSAASSMMASSVMSSSMPSSSMVSSAADTSSAAAAGTGSASRTQSSATSGTASATSSVVVSTGAAASVDSAGFVKLGLGLVFGGWLVL